MKFLLDDPAELTIQLEGAEQLWALKHALVLPRERVLGVVWHEHYVAPHAIWRVAGLGLPGRAWAGHFMAQGQPYFLYIKRPERGFWSFEEAPRLLELRAANDAGSITTILLSTSPKRAQEVLNWYNAGK